MMLLDTTARRVIMASYLYYRCDVSMIRDTEFDSMCSALADEWSKLTPLRQFMLGSARAIRSSGFHVRITRAAEGGAISWASKSNQPLTRGLIPAEHWKMHNGFRLQYAGIIE